MNDPVKVTIKFFAYIIGKCVAVALALAVIAFLTGMNTLNVSTLVKDAFTIRASVIVDQNDNEDVALIENVFSKGYIRKEGLDELTDNKAYDVTNYNQDTIINHRIVWPWEEEITLTVKDVVDDVRCTLVNETVDRSLLKEDYLIESGVYEVTLKKLDEDWVITDIVLTELIEPEIRFPLPVPEEPATVAEESEEVADEAAEQDTAQEE